MYVHACVYMCVCVYVRPKCSGAIEYLGKYAFLKKMFKKKIARYKVMFLVRLTV